MNELTDENEILLERSSQLESPSDVDKKSIDSDYEKSLSIIGLGKFHLLLLFVCGLANASDAIEILCISFVMPSAECDLKMNSFEKGLLSSMTFLGMMIGGYFWGSLSDISGRKYVLITALLFNAVFGLLSGLSQTYLTLLFFRFLSGIGVGGSVPIVWSYFSEFIPKDIRGRMICCLASSWFFGNLLVILFGYVTLHVMSLNFEFYVFSSKFLLNDWRIFMVTCALPSFVAAFLVFFLPESPKFCLYNGRSSETKRILLYMYKFNHKSINLSMASEHFDKLENDSVQLFQSRTFNDEEDTNTRALIYANKFKRRSCKSFFKYYICLFGKNITSIFKKSRLLFKKPFTVNTILITFIMFSLCFGYYGLWIWLPELYKRMSINGGSPCRVDSLIPVNQTIFSNDTSNCRIERKVFVSSFYNSLSNLPGNIFTILFIDKMGRNVVTSLSLILSGLSVFGIPFIRSENEGVILATLFGGINVITFNSFGCTATELYPTKLRSSALGVQYVAGRVGAILGNILFGLAVDINCLIPLVTITGLLVLSGVITLKLPESKNADIG